MWLLILLCFLLSLTVFPPSCLQVTQLEDYARARQPAPRLKRSSSSPPSGGGFSGSATEKVSPLLVGVVDCLWNAVVGNNPSTARFLAVGGLDALLNLLEVSGGDTGSTNPALTLPDHMRGACLYS